MHVKKSVRKTCFEKYIMFVLKIDKTDNLRSKSTIDYQPKQVKMAGFEIVSLNHDVHFFHYSKEVSNSNR